MWVTQPAEQDPTTNNYTVLLAEAFAVVRLLSCSLVQISVIDFKYLLFLFFLGQPNFFWTVVFNNICY